MAVGIAACGGGRGADNGAVVDVTLLEWELGADPGRVWAGVVSFEVSNEGGVSHNLVVVEVDLPPGELPVSDGAVEISKLKLEGGAAPFTPGPDAGGPGR